MNIPTRSVLITCLALTAACDKLTIPLPGAANWIAASGWPSGAYAELSLKVAGSSVTGSGEAFGIAGHPEGILLVKGSWSADSFNLVLSDPSTLAKVAQYVGVHAPTELNGTWTQSGNSRTVVFGPWVP